MSDPEPAAGPSGTSWRVVNLVLIALALLLVATAVLLYVRRDRSEPDTQAGTLSEQYAAVSKAARAETLAFLTVDYQKMDELIAKVLQGAAGRFKSQYGGAKESLVTSVKQAQAVSSGKVLRIGIGDLDSQGAVVFVAANSQVSNKTTKGKLQPRYYRLKLTMVRQGDRWLTSDLEFVG